MIKAQSFTAQLTILTVCSGIIWLVGMILPKASVPRELRFLALLILLVMLAATVIRAKVSPGIRRWVPGGAEGVSDAQAEATPLVRTIQRVADRLFHPITFCIVLALLQAAFSYGKVLALVCDEGIWSYVAHAWLHFDLPPYVGAMENKTPGIFYLFAVSEMLFGVNSWFPRLLGIIVMALTTYGIYAIGKRLLDHTAGMFAMIIYGLCNLSGFLDGDKPAQVETFMIGFAVLAVLLVLRSARASTLRGYLLTIFLVGCCLGGAVAFKQTALFTALGILLFYFAVRSPYTGSATACMRDLVIAVSGLGVVTVLSLIPLWLSGVTFKDYLDGAWLILFAPGSSAGSLGERMKYAMMAAERPEIQLFLPLLLLGTLLHKQIRARGVLYAGLLGWMICDLLAANLPGSYFGHQLRQALPAVALFCGISLRTLLALDLATVRLAPQHLALMLTASLFIWWPPFEIATKPQHVRFVRETAQWLRAHTSPRESVYIFSVWDGHPIIVYAGRRSASRHFHQYFISDSRVAKELRHDLETHPPKYLLLPVDGTMSNLPQKKVPRWAYALARTSYRYCTTRGFTVKDRFDVKRQHGYRIYELLPPDQRSLRK